MLRRPKCPTLVPELSKSNLRIAAHHLMQNVPQDLHRNQGVNHLNKVLDYAPFVEEEGKAVVHLTAEDWHVVADTLFHMETPQEFLPEAIIDYSLKNGNRTIELKTTDLLIDLEII